MEDQRVRKVMTQGLITVALGSKLTDVVRTLCEKRVHAVVVVDDQAQACGVVTKVDVLRHLTEDPSVITVDEVMTPRIITISPDAPLGDAVSLMLTKRVHQLVVAADDPAQQRRPVGMISVSDVVEALCEITRER